MFGDIQLHPEVEIESARDHDHKILQENKLQMTLDDNFHAADSLQHPSLPAGPSLHLVRNFQVTSDPALQLRSVVLMLKTSKVRIRKFTMIF